MSIPWRGFSHQHLIKLAGIAATFLSPIALVLLGKTIQGIFAKKSCRQPEELSDVEEECLDPDLPYAPCQIVEPAGNQKRKPQQVGSGEERGVREYEQDLIHLVSVPEAQGFHHQDTLCRQGEAGHFVLNCTCEFTDRERLGRQQGDFIQMESTPVNAMVAEPVSNTRQIVQNNDIAEHFETREIGNHWKVAAAIETQKVTKDPAKNMVFKVRPEDGTRQKQDTPNQCTEDVSLKEKPKQYESVTGNETTKLQSAIQKPPDPVKKEGIVYKAPNMKENIVNVVAAKQAAEPRSTSSITDPTRRSKEGKLLGDPAIKTESAEKMECVKSPQLAEQPAENKTASRVNETRSTRAEISTSVNGNVKPSIILPAVEELAQSLPESAQRQCNNAQQDAACDKGSPSSPISAVPSPNPSTVREVTKNSLEEYGNSTSPPGKGLEENVEPHKKLSTSSSGESFSTANSSCHSSVIDLSKAYHMSGLSTEADVCHETKDPTQPSPQPRERLDRRGRQKQDTQHCKDSNDSPIFEQITPPSLFSATQDSSYESVGQERSEADDNDSISDLQRRGSCSTSEETQNLSQWLSSTFRGWLPGFSQIQKAKLDSSERQENFASHDIRNISIAKNFHPVNPGLSVLSSGCPQSCVSSFCSFRRTLGHWKTELNSMNAALSSSLRSRCSYCREESSLSGPHVCRSLNLPQGLLSSLKQMKQTSPSSGQCCPTPQEAASATSENMNHGKTQRCCVEKQRLCRQDSSQCSGVQSGSEKAGSTHEGACVHVLLDEVDTMLKGLQTLKQCLSPAESMISQIQSESDEITPGPVNTQEDHDRLCPTCLYDKICPVCVALTADKEQKLISELEVEESDIEEGEPDAHSQETPSANTESPDSSPNVTEYIEEEDLLRDDQSNVEEVCPNETPLAGTVPEVCTEEAGKQASKKEENVDGVLLTTAITSECAVIPTAVDNEDSTVINDNEGTKDRYSENNSTVEDTAMEDKEDTNDRYSENNSTVEDTAMEDKEDTNDRYSENNSMVEDTATEDKEDTNDRYSENNSTVEDTTMEDKEDTNDRYSENNFTVQDTALDDNQDTHERNSENNSTMSMISPSLSISLTEELRNLEEITDYLLADKKDQEECGNEKTSTDAQPHSNEDHPSDASMPENTNTQCTRAPNVFSDSVLIEQPLSPDRVNHGMEQGCMSRSEELAYKKTRVLGKFALRYLEHIEQKLEIEDTEARSQSKNASDLANRGDQSKLMPYLREEYTGINIQRHGVCQGDRLLAIMAGSNDNNAKELSEAYSALSDRLAQVLDNDKYKTKANFPAWPGDIKRSLINFQDLAMRATQTPVNGRDSCDASMSPERVPSVVNTFQDIIANLGKLRSASLQDTDESANGASPQQESDHDITKGLHVELTSIKKSYSTTNAFSQFPQSQESCALSSCSCSSLTPDGKGVGSRNMSVTQAFDQLDKVVNDLLKLMEVQQ